MARLRIERALLSLPSDIRQPSDYPIDVVVLSRLIIALNTVATALCEAHGKLRPDDILLETADLLWSIGEQAAAVSPGLEMRDCSRPASAAAKVN
jgi:hypothetical protein